MLSCPLKPFNLTRQGLATGMLSTTYPILCCLLFFYSNLATANDCSVITKSEYMNGKVCTVQPATADYGDRFNLGQSIANVPSKESSLKLKLNEFKAQTLDRYLEQNMGQLTALVTPLDKGEQGKKLFLDVDSGAAELKWQWNF